MTSWKFQHFQPRGKGDNLRALLVGAETYKATDPTLTVHVLSY